LLKSVTDWLWSSFHRFVKMRYYEEVWGGAVGNQTGAMRYAKLRGQWVSDPTLQAYEKENFQYNRLSFDTPFGKCMRIKGANR
jgi:hypothetical protein